MIARQDIYINEFFLSTKKAAFSLTGKVSSYRFKSKGAQYYGKRDEIRCIWGGKGWLGGF